MLGIIFTHLWSTENTVHVTRFKNYAIISGRIYVLLMGTEFLLTHLLVCHCFKLPINFHLIYLFTITHELRVVSQHHMFTALKNYIGELA